MLYRWLYGQLDCLCFDSELSKGEFLSTHPEIDEAKLCIVHTSIVVPEGVKPADLRTELSIPTDTVLAMYHGRLDAEKGLDTLVEAAAMLKGKNFRLVLIGRGSDDYTAHLQQLIAEKGLEQQVSSHADFCSAVIHQTRLERKYRAFRTLMIFLFLLQATLTEALQT
jgi:glycosyltransferase involved in cell wall biosynthesis